MTMKRDAVAERRSIVLIARATRIVSARAWNCVDITSAVLKTALPLRSDDLFSITLFLPLNMSYRRREATRLAQRVQAKASDLAVTKAARPSGLVSLQIQRILTE